ncbi:MAG: MotA/TolQ/ExbB proton channel family protein [Pseudomonadota bacterium]
MTDVFARVSTALQGILDLGGPVVMLLLALSVVAAAVAIYKLWQLAAARVGRHARLQAALAAWDGGDRAAALRAVRESRSHLAPLVETAMRAPDDPNMRARLEAEAENNLAKLEGGFRILDSIAQIAPLLGLFGTVLGMIDAFRALQAAGAAVDPSVLAGGIWVALLTTAVGLAVAMPTQLVLTWLEGRVSRDRAFAEVALARTRVQMGAEATALSSGQPVPARAGMGRPAPQA